jgi:hypothetical protein
MIIETGEVPDAALDALLEAAPSHPDSLSGEHMWREDWRQALAAALTAWEARPHDLTLAAAHECTWRTVGVQHRDALFGIKQTDVLQRCDGCGEVRAPTLNGTWTLEQLKGAP